MNDSIFFFPERKYLISFHKNIILGFMILILFLILRLFLFLFYILFIVLSFIKFSLIEFN